MKNDIFQEETASLMIQRINKLTNDSTPVWGTMDVGKMLAHCNVTYEMVYDNIHPKPNFILQFILKKLVKNKVVSDEPYQKNGRTAPQFVMKNEKDFTNEKGRLINYIEKTKTLGVAHFEGLESLSFGKLTSAEWNNMFYKHLDHHLNQFGV